MQDRFKFRAWSEKRKEYIYNVQNCSNHCYRCFKVWVIMDGAEIVQLEQCTGMKDKNGKLIYEGDIVETHDYTTEYSQIVFDKGCYVLKSKDSAMYEHLSSYEEECKIVGNIHENSSLLKNNQC